MIREVKAEAQRVLDKARGMVRRGLLQLAGVNGSIQVEGYDGEVFTRVEHWNSWGIESRPPAGADVLLVLVGGDGSQPISIAMSHRAHRPTGLNVGDAALYGSKDGSDQAVAYARADGSIDLLPGGSEFVNVGGDSEKLLLGESLTTRMVALNAAITGLGIATGPDAAVINGIKTALINFTATALTLLATKGKVT